MSGGVWGCLGVSEWYSWKSEALRYVFWVSGFSVLQYGAKTPFWHNPKRREKKSFRDIKIPKPPHISFPKMFGLGNFSEFLGSPKRNYLLPLLLITLYQ